MHIARLNNIMLNAEKLIEEGNKPTTLPDMGGIKYFAYDPDDNEQKESTDHALQQYSKCLKEERICKKMNLSIAQWEKSQNLALVTVMKGSTLQKFGFQCRNGKFLYPEECLFLVEQGMLELNLHDLPLSFQEAYMLLIPLLPSFEYYQVYVHLSRQGFILTRYQESIARNDQNSKDCCLPKKNPIQKPSEVPDVLKSGHMKDLWRGTVNPMIQPCEATSTSSILSKIQCTHLSHLKSSFGSYEVEDTKFNISFDVYTSKEQHKQTKNKTALPQYRIVICKYEDDPPSLKDLALLTRASKGIHLKVAVVHQGTVTFYGIFSSDLPSIFF